MKIRLTDNERLKHEKNNIINVVLAAERRGKPIDEKRLSLMLGIEISVVNKCLNTLKEDNVITIET